MRHAEQLHAYLAAYARLDLPAIEALLAPDVRLQDWQISAEGRAAVLRETAANFAASTSIEITVRQVFEAPDGAAAWLHIVVNGRIALDVVDVLRFDGAGRITEIRAFKG